MTTVRRQNLTHATQERMMVQARHKEDTREDHLKRLANEKVLEANMASEERVENKRHIRRLQQEQQEINISESITKAQQDRIQREQQMEQEERMTNRLQTLKLESQRNEKVRQQIRENSLELRELEAKLRAGYMNRERAAQIAEKEASKYEKTARDAEIARLMKDESARAESQEQKQLVDRYQESVHYQQELEKQLEEQEKRKQQDYEEFLKEKLMIDEIVRKIHEEDEREREIYTEKQVATKRYIDEDAVARQKWKDLERQKMEQENMEILKFATLQQVREEDRMENKRAEEEVKASVQKSLSDDIARKRAMEEEMERVREELYHEEQEESQRQKEYAEIERQIRQRLELQKTYQEQLRLKRMRRQAELGEEEEFKRQMLAKFEEDDRIEQMNAQRRRMKQLEHKRRVEDLLQARRAQFAADKDREREEREEAENLEKLRMQIIEEERQRLLREHASKLLGFLPKGVIRDEHDLELFDDDFKRNYSGRQRDMHSADGWE